MHDGINIFCLTCSVADLSMTSCGALDCMQRAVFPIVVSTDPAVSHFARCLVSHYEAQAAGTARVVALPPTRIGHLFPFML